jgi:hypothetical protein
MRGIIAEKKNKRVTRSFFVKASTILHIHQRLFFYVHEINEQFAQLSGFTDLENFLWRKCNISHK